MTLASRALRELASWPELAEAPASCGRDRALRAAAHEIVHFHADQDVDLHLTARAIRRLEDDLVTSPAIQLVPGSPWITLHLSNDRDIDLLMTLVSAALQAHQTWPVPSDIPSAGCNDRFGAALPRQSPS
ncbi:luciferase family protein [Streptomyces sp. NPDC048751]|uniref:luciferase domain-containing protein n=1 Tax=Streptomyces sp. NPDC048751 TaxID=3365591 RepID=UPI00371943C9